METSASVTEVLARFAVAGPVPRTSHRRQIVDALLDTVGCALAARNDGGSLRLHEWAAVEAGEGATGGVATVWSSGVTTSVGRAALINGTDGHALDYDDISPTMPMHPSTVLFPALVAGAEARGLAGDAVLEAYDVGAAVFHAVCDVLPGNEHYADGWHITSTVGRLAATAALSRLWSLTLEQAQHALGIVSSHISGSRANFGSMTKPLHAGLAARDAVFAVELAERGFTANPRELEARGGFFEKYGHPDLAPVGDPAETLHERLEFWVEAWVTDWGLKSYPACYATHRAIDAIRGIRDAHGSDAERLVPREIRVSMYRHGTDPLRREPPVTAQQAKFSMPYVAATAWVTGDVRLRDFTDAAFAESHRQEVAERVVLEELAVAPFGEPRDAAFWCTVQIDLGEGTVRRARVDVTRGDSSEPLSRGDLRAKFDDCAGSAGVSASQAESVWRGLLALGDGGLVREAVAPMHALRSNARKGDDHDER